MNSGLDKLKEIVPVQRKKENFLVLRSLVADSSLSLSQTMRQVSYRYFLESSCLHDTVIYSLLCYFIIGVSVVYTWQ